MGWGANVDVVKYKLNEKISFVYQKSHLFSGFILS